MVRSEPLIGASESGRMPSGGKLLHNSSLLRVLAGFGLLNASEWGFVTALSIDAFRLGGTLYVGLIGLRFLAGALSSALFAPLFASRRGVLSVIALLRAATLGVAAALTIAGSPFVVVLLFVVLDSIVAAVYRPAQSRLMPSLARSPQELTQAVAGTSMAKTIGQAAGALIGGAAVDVVSPGAAMAGEAGVMLRRARLHAWYRWPSRGRGRRLGTQPQVPGWQRSRGFSGSERLAAGGRQHAAHARTWSMGGAPGGRRPAPAAREQFKRRPAAGGDRDRRVHRIAGHGLLRSVARGLRSHASPRSWLRGITVGLISTAPALPLVAVLVCLWGASMAMADATSLSLLHRLLTTDAFSRTVAVMESLKLVSEGAGALAGSSARGAFRAAHGAGHRRDCRCRF